MGDSSALVWPLVVSFTNNLRKVLRKGDTGEAWSVLALLRKENRSLFKFIGGRVVPFRPDYLHTYVDHRGIRMGSIRKRPD